MQRLTGCSPPSRTPGENRRKLRVIPPKLQLVAVTFVAFVALFASLSYRAAAVADYLPGGSPKTQQDRGSKSRSIKGRVVDDAGRPLAGASVTLIPAGGDRDGEDRQAVRTSEDGHFSFESVADQPYTIVVGGFQSLDGRGYHLPGDDVTIRVEKGGVITGRVTSVDGEPLVGLRVVARCVGARTGNPPLSFFNELSRTRLTDDRGIYRFWGLQPGVYIVSAGPAPYLIASAYDDDSPTYYPSSTLGSASRLELSSGQELTGIDISYRGYSGQAISGTVQGSMQQGYCNITLSTLGGDDLDSVFLPAGQSSGPFAFSKVSEGEYVVVAVAGSRNGIPALSPPRTVSVKGADVTRIDLKLVQLGILSGRISLQDDPAPGCKTKAGNTLAEVLLSIKTDGPPKDNYPSFIQAQLTYAASPDATGQFTMKRVPAGAYRVDIWLPTPDWYVSAIAQGSGSITSTTRSPHYVASQGISIGEGQSVSGLNVVMRNGAAGLSGRVVLSDAAGSEAAGTPKAAESRVADSAVSAPGLMVYLTPVESSRAGEQLRSYETEAAGDGSYQFKNLPPGKYRIAARTVQEQDRPRSTDQPVRQTPRRLGKSGDNAPLIELHPCERRTDYALRYKQSR